MAFNQFGKINNIFKILLIIQVIILNAYGEYANNEYATKRVGATGGYDDYFDQENRFIDEMKWEDLVIDTRALIRTSRFEFYQTQMKSKYYWAARIPYAMMTQINPAKKPFDILALKKSLETALNWHLTTAVSTNNNQSESTQFNYKFEYKSNNAEEPWLRDWRDLTNALLRRRYDQAEVLYFTILYKNNSIDIVKHFMINYFGFYIFQLKQERFPY